MRFVYGVLAGLGATAVASVLMLLARSLGLAPELDVVRLLADMAGGARGSGSQTLGWLLYVLIGTVVWGLVFAAVVPLVRGSFWLKGLLFGVAAWLLLTILAMRLAGIGLSALALGLGAPVMALMLLHAAYGVVLGLIYGRLLLELQGPSDRAEADAI